MTIPTNPSLNEEWTNDATDVTYKWDGERWYIVSTTDAELEENYVTKVAFQADQERQDTEFSEDQQRQDEDIAVLEELVKGVSYIYTVDNTVGTAVSRPGKIGINTTFYLNVNKFSFGTEAADGTETPAMSTGDIIETFSEEENLTNRYKITNASGAPTIVNVEHISGKFSYFTGAELQVQIYKDSNVASLEARVAVGETRQGQIETTVSDALETQGNIVDNINILTTKVEALEGTVIDGKWYAESRSTPRTGGFDITKGGVQSMSNWDADFMRIHKTDNSGKVFTFAEIGVGDYIRVGAPGSTAVYKITSVPTGSLDWQAFGVEPVSSTGQPVPELVYDFEFLPSFDPSAYATIDYVDDRDDLNFKKTGGTITGGIAINRGEKAHPQWKITPNSGSTNFATNIYSLGDGDMRFRTSHTSNEEDHVGSHIVLSANGGSPETKIYNVVEAGESAAVPKSYVDNAVASAGGGGGVPVGSIMIWMNSTAPAGWFKLQGGSFDTSTYPQLHAYLQNTSGYSSGKLPSWSGHYPGEYGGHLNGSMGEKVTQRTAQPNGGAPRSSTSIPSGTTRTFNGAGGTSAYSDGTSKVTINEGWDTYTRPQTVIVHYIIKHD